MDRDSLGTVSLFVDLPPQTLHDIQARCSWRQVAAGDLVFDRENDTLDVYFVLRGSVRILNIADDGREVALADIGQGNYFGELAAIDGMRRSARVIAIQDSVLASLDGASFLEFMRSSPIIALRVLERLTCIIRNLDDRVIRMSVQSESQRIWTQLLKMVEPDPSRNGGWIIRDMPNHREIAVWSGTSREQVAQAIGDLARDGIVRRRTSGLIICDLPRLQFKANAGAAG